MAGFMPRQKTRAIPLKAQKARAIEEQTGRCAYCNSSLVDLDIVWDHFIPHSYTLTNHDSNWVAACKTCNAHKYNHVFNSVGDLEAFCLSMVKSHGSRGEGWPDGSTTAFKEYI